MANNKNKRIEKTNRNNSPTLVIKSPRQTRLFLFLCFTFLMLHTLPSAAQEKRRPILEKIEAQRVAHMTQILDLNSSEAEKFWPLYNAYKKEELSIRRQFPHWQKEPSEIKSLSDQEARQLIDQMLQSDESLLKLKQSYFKKFITVLPPQKVALIPEAERSFREQVVRRVSEGPMQRRKWRD